MKRGRKPNATQLINELKRCTRVTGHIHHMGIMKIRLRLN